MTPGQEALAEAMRLEQARIYSHVQQEHRSEVVAAAPVLPAPVPATLQAAIERGWPNSRIMRELHTDYQTVQRARQQAGQIA